MGDHCDECETKIGCEHGTCDVPNECNCNAGWAGPLCNIGKCATTNMLCYSPWYFISRKGGAGTGVGAFTKIIQDSSSKKKSDQIMTGNLVVLTMGS